MQFKTIQARLTCIISLVLLITILALGFSSNLLAQQLMLRAVEKNGQAVAADYAFRVQSYFQEATTQLEDLASMPQLRTNISPDEVSAILGDTLKRIGKFESMSCVTLDNVAIRADGTVIKITEQEQHSKAKATRQPAVSKVTVAASTGKMSVIICVPVIEKGELTGLVTGVMSLDKVTSIIANSKFEQTGYALLLDSEGLLIANSMYPEQNGRVNYLQQEAAPAFGLVRKEFDERQIALVSSAALQGKQAMANYSGLDGVERIGVTTPLELPGGQRWVMMVTAPAHEVIADVNTLTTTMAIIGFVCLLFALLIALLVSRSFVSPIVMLRNEARLIADGDLEKRRTVVARADELGELARAFAHMSANLRSLIQVRARAEKLLSLGTMAAGISHEINQPLNSIKLISSGLVYTYKNGKKREVAEIMENIEEISHQADRISNIMSHMRSLIRRDSSQIVPCDVNAAIEKSLDMLGSKLSAHCITMRVCLGVLPAVNATPLALEEITLNLVDNSLQALDLVQREEKIITIETGLVENTVTIRISDNGPGISEADREMIFEPFFSTKGSGDNMGLGLSVVQSIVTACGGKIRLVNSGVGGAAFEISFPAVIDDK